MFETLLTGLNKVLDLDHLSMVLVLTIMVRSFILYILTIVFIRINKKLMGVSTPENFTLSIILGSLCAAGIIGEASFVVVVLGILFLILLNKLTAIIFFNYPKIESFVVGIPVVLVQDGNILWHNMKTHHITESDLLNALHEKLHTDDLAHVKVAYLDITGSINFIKYT